MSLAYLDVPPEAARTSFSGFMTLSRSALARSLRISGSLAHKPDVLRAFNQLHAALWAEGALDAKLKHLAYLRASVLAGCGY